MKRRHFGGCTIVEKSDEVSLQLLGGERHESVALTHDQISGLAEFYGFDLERDKHPLIRAGNIRNLMRESCTDGLRVMAFLAKYGFLEKGEDVVTTLAESLDQSLFRSSPDIWNEDDLEEGESEDASEDIT